jgi:transcriptional repressor NrdR
MKCPYCHVDDDRVVDSRTSKEGYAIRRRRECLNCQRRYTTFERLEQLGIKVVKKDGIRESFDPEKLRSGIGKACWKRPVSDEQIDDLVDNVQSELYSRPEKEIDSDALGELIMQRLRDVDQVAYIRFASVYREFKDVHDFVDEMKPMLEQTLGEEQSSN